MITPEMIQLIPKIDISTPEKLAAFKHWQFEDGSIEGLRALYQLQCENSIKKDEDSGMPEDTL